MCLSREVQRLRDFQELSFMNRGDQVRHDGFRIAASHGLKIRAQ